MEYVLTEQQVAMLKQRFLSLMPEFIDFANPGETLEKNELDYKNNILKRFNDELGNSALRDLVQKKKGLEAQKRLAKIVTSNLVSFMSWRPSFGTTDEQSADVIAAYLKVAEHPYVGPETIAPIFAALHAHNLRPKWDTLSTTLWAMRPSDYFPIKISYYRRLAEKLGWTLPSGSPTAVAFDDLMHFGQAFWLPLKACGVRDWVDVQSFMWVVCDDTYGGGIMIADTIKRFLLQASTVDLRTKDYPASCGPFAITVSFGQGNPARIPWIAMLHESQEVQRGIYPVYLYYKQEKKLLLCYGRSETHIPAQNWDKGRINGLPTVGEVIKDPPRYKLSYVYKQYDVANNELVNVSDESIDEDCRFIVKQYEQQMGSGGGSMGGGDIVELMQKFVLALESCSLKVSGYLPVASCAALLSKRFLLLTGLSGSGKTMLGQCLAQWFSSPATHQGYALVAVGADWTSNENLLGYPDALTKLAYRKPDNGVLDLILRAKDDPDHPYFLILDEMNLSHVERYFADFLSAMESVEPINLHDDTGSDWNGVPAKLKIPDNLFVIGTVNVDETTYMFSPKVLDRANVIEFRVDKTEMEGFLANPAKPDLEVIAGKGAQYGKAFVAEARQKNVQLDEDTRAQVTAELMKLFPQLQEAGAEFGYRTAHEICRFVYFHKKLAGEGWKFDDAMDAAIMQKLLPKLHGSKKKLGPVLEKLDGLCAGRFTASIEKIERMRKRLAEHGFTSFAEA